MEALYYSQVNGKVRCLLCPHNCLIKEGTSGICRVRENEGGTLYARTYGNLSALHFDPIEKKPLYHFYPGTQILSLGSVGCNMRCKCCQNWQISQAKTDDFPYENHYPVSKIVDIALSRPQNIGVAYTYNEPAIWYEYVLDVSKAIHNAGMKNVMVSNGYINEEPLVELFKYMDAFNIDLKAFNNEFYKNITGAELEPVKHTLKVILRHKKHLEITNLVIPTQNDQEEEFRDMVSWISTELGRNTVLHLSRYYPMYKMNIPSTDADVLSKLYQMAKKKLNYVYVGNISLRDYQNTKCHKCHSVLIKRNGYHIETLGINQEGNCMNCGNSVIINN